MSDNTDGFVPSIQAKSDATQQKQNAVKPDSASPASPQKNSGGTSDGFVPSIHSKSKPSEENEQPSTFEKADKAITDTLAPNPNNYESLTRTNLIEVPKTLGREVYSAGKTIASMPGSIYHAFADEATPEEKQQYAQVEKEAGESPGSETSGLKRIGLGLQRISGAPAAIEAAKTYANPKTRPSYEQILENAPEALGQGAGTAVGGELIHKAGGAAVEKTPAAISKAADITSKATKNALPKIQATIERASTPKNLATEAGALIPGAHAIGSVVGRVGSEVLLGKEAANTPLIKFGPRIPKGAEALGKISLPEEPTAETAPEPKTAAPEAPNPLTRNMTPIGQTVRPAGFPKIGESPLAQTLEQTEAAVKPAVEAAKAEATGLKPIGSEATPKPEAEPALKPIGAEPEPTTEEPKEVRRARHILGDHVVDALQNSDHPQVPEVLQRLTNATYKQWADLANETGIKKPGYLKARNGEAWTAEEFKRTMREHGKELSGPKELVARELVNKPPAEILQHTKPWVDSTAKYPTRMSGLTERTMEALGLSEEARNNMRSSGVSDAQAQSLLAKLSKRQLNNLSGTNLPKVNAKGSPLDDFGNPTVSGGSQGADQPQRVSPATLTNEIDSEPDYVYHATNAERLQDIADSGRLDIHKPNYGTDQDAWPDGSITKRAYFTRKANVAE